MASSNKFMLKPGTVFLVIVGILLTSGMYFWISEYFDRTGAQSVQEGAQSIDCSTLSVDFVDEERNETHKEYFIQVDKPAKRIVTVFRGQENHSVIRQDFDSGEIKSFSAPVNDLETVEVHVQGCERVFTR